MHFAASSPGLDVGIVMILSGAAVNLGGRGRRGVFPPTMPTHSSYTAEALPMTSTFVAAFGPWWHGPEPGWDG